MTGFGPAHLPYGVVQTVGGERFAATLVGDEVLDLRTLPRHGHLFAAPSLDALLAAEPTVWRDVRDELGDLVNGNWPGARVPVDGTRTVLPFTVADYVDFYASEHHATNVGRIFRPDGDPLTPNWKHLPIGYHGRAGTVVVSGEQIVRPRGQYRNPDSSVGFGPSRKLDIEAELGFVVGGPPTPLGTPVPISEAPSRIFGVVLLNDWSARDIQAWEYVPLGPFLGKSFATSVAGWITPMDALAAAYTAPPPRDKPLCSYLEEPDPLGGLDLTFDVRLNGSTIARPPYASMYWTPAQMLAHMSVNGARVRPGDLFASGTVSGPEPDQRGSLLELTWNGTRPLDLGDGTSRGFLEDGDEVAITASARGTDGEPLELAEVRGRIAPAKDA